MLRSDSACWRVTPGFQPAHGPEIPVEAFIDPRVAGFNLWLHGDGNPEFRPENELGSEETGGHDAQYGVRETVDLYRLADDAGVAGEATAPTVVAEDDDGVCTNFLVVRRGQCAAQERRDAQDFEIVSGYLVAPDVGVVAVLAHVDRSDAHGDQTCKALVAIPKIFVIGIGLVSACPIAVQRYQFLGPLDGQGAQQQFVDGAERYRVCADAECQGDDGGEGEARALLQTAKSEPEVLQQVVHRGPDCKTLQAQ